MKVTLLGQLRDEKYFFHVFCCINVAYTKAKAKPYYKGYMIKSASI
jgi:hypothetical protein